MRWCNLRERTEREIRWNKQNQTAYVLNERKSRVLLSFCVEIEWQQKARQELGEECEIRRTKLKQLEELIVADIEIPNARRDDAFLLRFLRAKKFDVDKSFRMVI